MLEAETTRLARVEARLLTIEDEARAPADGVVVKRLAPVRVGELTAEAAGWEPEAITPVIRPLYCDLWQRMASAEVTAAGPAVAYYEDAPGGRRRDRRARRRAGSRRGRRGIRASASWTCRRWKPPPSSFTTAPWTT